MVGPWAVGKVVGFTALCCLRLVLGTFAWVRGVIQ